MYALFLGRIILIQLIHYGFLRLNTQLIFVGSVKIKTLTIVSCICKFVDLIRLDFDV